MRQKHNKSCFWKILGIVFVGVLIIFPHFCLAGETGTLNLGKSVDWVENGLGGGANATSDSKTLIAMPQIIGIVIALFLNITGVFLVVFLVFAGFLWVTSGGNPEKLTKARGYIVNTLIGLIILLSAYAIADFIIIKLTGAEMNQALSDMYKYSSKLDNYNKSKDTKARETLNFWESDYWDSGGGITIVPPKGTSIDGGDSKSLSTLGSEFFSSDVWGSSKEEWQNMCTDNNCENNF